MAARITRPTTAMRLRKKRLATMAPGDSTLTRRSSLREYSSEAGVVSTAVWASACSLSLAARMSFLSLSLIFIVASSPR